MAGFTSSEDLRRYVGGIFETALADDVLGPRLVSTGLLLRLTTTEPDAVLTIDLPNGRIETGETAVEPNATMVMTSDVANRFWQGKVNLTFAMARGQVKVGGNIGSLLKLLPSTKLLFPAYVGMLTEDGREDLLAG